MVNPVNTLNVTQELVTQTLAQVGSLNQTGNIENLQVGRDLTLRLPHVDQLVEPGILNNNLSNIWLYGAEGVVLGRDGKIGEKIETGTFSYIWKSNDSHFEFVFHSSPGCFLVYLLLFAHLYFIKFF
jgi:hypothetical protein